MRNPGEAPERHVSEDKPGLTEENTLGGFTYTEF